MIAVENDKGYQMSSALSLQGISKRLGGREILKDVSFTVNRGDVFGYLGPNGAGKTTTIRILLGLLPPSSGSARIMGQDASLDESRRSVGFVLEADGLYDNMTARDNIAYYARIYGVSRPEEQIEKSLKMVNLSDKAGEKVGTYSKGMRQRLTLARAMVHNPDILILDEPTAGIDPSGQIEIRKIVFDMTHREGKTIFLSSHNLDEVQRICNRIALIDGGRIRLYGELDELQRGMSQGEVIIETKEAVPEMVLAELNKIPEVGIRSCTERTLHISLDKNMDVSDVVRFLIQYDVRIEQVQKRQPSLEEIYTAILKEAGDKKNG
ncbi:MAG: ABC transporter ATP-binding protein [Chloroflexota bacterium]